MKHQNYAGIDIALTSCAQVFINVYVNRNDNIVCVYIYRGPQKHSFQVINHQKLYVNEKNFNIILLKDHSFIKSDICIIEVRVRKYIIFYIKLTT